MNKKNLQIVTFVLAWIPIISGIFGLAGINDPLYGKISAADIILLDNNLRFFNGAFIGLGIATLSIVTKIDTQTEVFRFIWLCIFLGGMSRLLSVVFTGIPPLSLICFMAVEIAGAPFFIYWQYKIRKQ